ncbi:glycoside hydrolase superfamily [Microdochium bolleyi]|uniref:Beta-mannosidase B n=1 Tax=Microdochium bolleyi TaxID=196109 RepID=A0A136IUX6_9PEZI|nr:glycoside hydrolase superfamily [Microdochium bolleyi]
MQRRRHDLSTGWTFRETGGTSQAWLPVAKVPSQVHLDLLANDIIADPFCDLNELDVQWVAERDWTYRVQFVAPMTQGRLDGVTTTLVFEGLDTFARVTLNGVEILVSENMHLAHRIDVSNLLRDEGENLLEIDFQSALLRGRELVRQHPEHDFFARQTEESRIPVRKAQYNWGWDWGPILMTAGPWRPVYVEEYQARVDDLWARYELDTNLKTCAGVLSARVDGVTSKDDLVILTLSFDDVIVFEKNCTLDPSGVVATAFQIEDIKLWHVAGHGAQHRYRLSATIIRGKTELDSRSKMIGFRRCELIQEPDAFGKSFYFRINGVDTFAGGSCWIPADSFLANMSSQKYFEWMKLLAESNQVMVRIWGGGIYEDDALFEACDSLGLLVWHDFAFVCGNYPVFPAFLANIEAEARQNIRRLRCHPSVVIWAGNNEDYQVQERYKLDYVFEDKDPESWKRSSFPARYIYEDLLPRILKEEDPQATYHPGSPWGDGKHTTDPTVGDIHQWNIWHGQMSRYQDSHELSGRFVSEFGMEAYPHFQTIRRMVSKDEQRFPGSMTMDFRNKAADHERRLNTYLCENFRVSYDLPSFTHLTQILQADTMKYAYKAWRRMWGARGSRRCGGVLVWQLNDCWPTMSWAVVDYYMVKKPAFYSISRALRPLDIGISRSCPEWTSGHADPTLLTAIPAFDVWVASSCLEDVQVVVEVRLISIRSGKEIGPPISKIVFAQANSTTEIFQNKRPQLSSPEDVTSAHRRPFDPASHDPFVIYAILRRNDAVVATDTAWPQPYKYLDFADRKVSVKMAPSGDNITVTTERPVLGFVLEEVEGLTLSDNGFDIMPGEEQVVKIKGGTLPAPGLDWTYVGAEHPGRVQMVYKPRLSSKM